MAFENPDGSFESEWAAPPIRVTTPASGATVTVNPSDRALYVAGGATLAALTLTLPQAEKQGHFVTVAFGVAVTALTVQGSYGQAVVGAPGAAAANASIEFRFIKGTGWVRWR